MRFTRNMFSICLIVGVMLAIGGCSNNGVARSPGLAQQQNVPDMAAKEKTVIDNYNELLQKKDVTLPEIKRYLDENITYVSQVGASSMVIGFEKVQKEKVAKLQDRFGDSQAVQKELAKNYRTGLIGQVVDRIEDKEAKDLIIEARTSGYKIETAEGMYFPVIDYTEYKKYRNSVTQDIAAFIDIMAVESDKTPVKDAALMISWSEVLKRAQEQEKFIKDYGNSAKVEDMKQLLSQYLAFAMYGANNTPLFGYDTKQMVPEARKTYLETSFDANKGGFSEVMDEYMALLKKNDYKLTPEVQEYRNKASEKTR